MLATLTYTRNKFPGARDHSARQSAEMFFREIAKEHVRPISGWLNRSQVYSSETITAVPVVNAVRRLLTPKGRTMIPFDSDFMLELALKRADEQIDRAIRASYGRLPDFRNDEAKTKEIYSTVEKLKALLRRP